MISELVSHWSGTPWPVFPALRLSVTMPDLKDSGARTQVLSMPELSRHFKVPTIGKVYLSLVGRGRHAYSAGYMLSSDDNFQVLVIAFYRTFLVSALHTLSHLTTSSTDQRGHQQWQQGLARASQSTQRPPKNNDTITCWTRKNKEKQKAQETAEGPPWRPEQVYCCPAGCSHQGRHST